LASLTQIRSRHLIPKEHDADNGGGRTSATRSPYSWRRHVQPSSGDFDPPPRRFWSGVAGLSQFGHARHTFGKVLLTNGALAAPRSPATIPPRSGAIRFRSWTTFQLGLRKHSPSIDCGVPMLHNLPGTVRRTLTLVSDRHVGLGRRPSPGQELVDLLCRMSGEADRLSSMIWPTIGGPAPPSFTRHADAGRRQRSRAPPTAVDRSFLHGAARELELDAELRTQLPASLRDHEVGGR